MEDKTFDEFCEENKDILEESYKLSNKMAASLLLCMSAFAPAPTSACIAALLQVLLEICEDTRMSTELMRQLFQETLIRYNEKYDKEKG